MASENNPAPNGERESEETSLVPASSDKDGQIEVSDSDTPVSSEDLDKIPPDDRSIITRTFSSIAAQFIAPVANPILEKFTSAHISTILSNSENERIRESEADNSRRKYQFAYYFTGLVALIGLLVFFTLTDNGELIVPLITGALGFFGGLAAGRYTRNN